MMRISRSRARSFLLNYHNLSPPRRLRTDEDILSLIRKLGCIQYDPLRTSARNADLVLQSRCTGYREATLYRLLYEKRRLLDWWDKNMSIWPVEDWPCFARERARFRERYRRRAAELKEGREAIFALLEERDYVSSRDFADGTKVSWSWAPTSVARAALESMYHQGELLIHHKEGSRKFYAPAERLLPRELLKAPDPFPDLKSYHDWLVKRRIASVGLLWNRSSDTWLGTGLKKQDRSAALSRLEDRGEISSVEVEGPDEIFYLPAAEQSRLEEKPTDPPGEAAFLAPLDNLLWDRVQISRLFDFDYKWEVYTPVEQQRYGYYILPVLYGDRFIARCEPVMDRKTGTLRIKNWWWEPRVEITAEMEEALAHCLSEFCSFLGAPGLSLPPGLKLPDESRDNRKL